MLLMTLFKQVPHIVRDQLLARDRRYLKYLGVGLDSIMIISWNHDNKSHNNRTVRIFNTVI